MYSVIIIGAGPAGISMAVEAVVAGIPADKILVIEKAHEHSFSIRKYYPENKLVTANFKGFEAVCTGTMCIPDLSKHETISYLDQTIAEYGIHVQYEEAVWKIEHHEAEQFFTVITDKGEYESRVMAIAIGILGKPNKPEYKLPPGLKNNLLYDITSSEVLNSHVLVVGGGDTASEYCQYLSDTNLSVTLSYRKDEFSRMNDINRKSIEALGKTGKVTLLLRSEISGIQDSGGKALVQFTAPVTETREYDYVVFALGGTTPENFLKTIGIEFIGKDPVLKDGYETNIPGLFLLGDLSAGTKGGSIIWAFNSANTAIKRIIDRYI
ncbi:MAG: NAD(P)-binding domain-containing protein [Ignavibacteriales bacterium]|nr:NAD(P)-binding domain-containing protein [Ignavibacteriales bacterium]